MKALKLIGLSTFASADGIRDEIRVGRHSEVTVR